jgi:hypothetical protein
VAVAGLSFVIGLPAVVLGPWLIHLLFAAPRVLTRADFLWLVLGTFGYLLGMVLGQALIVLHRHRAQLLSWLLGTGVLCGVTALPGAIATRVTVAFAAGAAATALAMAWALTRRAAPRPGNGAPEPVTESIPTP